MIIRSGFIPELADAVKEAWEKWLEEIRIQMDIPTKEPVAQPIYLRL